MSATNIRRLTLMAASAALVTTIALASSRREVHAADEIPPRIQLAILLDTSNSMDGLIDQAKARLWKIVNEFLYAKKGDVTPRLEVALFEYGKSSLPESEGFLRRVSGLTDDLDHISQELFALTTNGGEEYCGYVIREAVQSLAWSPSPEDLKVVFIAGNEPFSQGPIDFRESCRTAIEQGILVNTIFCGDETLGVNTHWKDGALLADGSFHAIDSNQAVAHIAAPQDEAIVKLGTSLNETYIPYGAQGWANRSRQTVQDDNAEKLENGAAVDRAVCKSSLNYCNSLWDLVDAVERGSVELADVDVDTLPEAMQSMTAEQRAAHVQSMGKKRKAIQAEIQTLNAERSKYIAAKRAEEAPEASTLDVAIGNCLRTQAADKRFDLTPPPVETTTSSDTDADSRSGEGAAPENGDAEQKPAPKPTQKVAPAKKRIVLQPAPEDC